MVIDAARYAEHPLVRRLRSVMDLGADERAALAALASPPRTANTRRDLVRQGARPGAALVILSGWAAQYRTLEDGRRQSVALLLPGDICGLHDALLPQIDHSIGALRAVRYAEIGSGAVDRLSDRHPRLGQALLRQMLTATSIQREWTVNVGQRNSLERVGHLFCELFLRLRAIGLVHANGFEFPLTQSDIAEATGLTQVHVNRTVRQLRAQGLIEIADRVLTIHDPKALMRASLFSRAYLHLRDEPPADRAGTRHSEIGL